MEKINKIKMGRNQYILYKSCNGKYDAGNKFSDDVIEICKRQDIQPIVYGQKNSGGLAHRIIFFMKYIFDLLKIKKFSVIYILYPTMPKYFKYLCYVKRIRKCKLVGIIMDLPFLCRKVSVSTNDIGELLQMDAIILQNNKQKLLLENIGIVGKSIEEIGILDFLGNPNINSPDSRSYGGRKTILCYGGTLAYDSAGFLYKWAHSSYINKIKVNVYGRCLEKKLENPHFEYKGVFPPEEIVDNLEGDFGLVWSGSEIDYCGGMKGSYYDYASPHKLSMYLMAGMPVIIPKSSALADIVVSKNIGITVTSLDEIEDKLNRISLKEYAAMVNAVNKEAKKISLGTNLERCIKEVRKAFI